MRHNVFNQTERTIKSIDNIFGNFLVNSGLYDTIDIKKDNIYELADLVGGYVKINAYCTECKEQRVFSCEPIHMYKNDDGHIAEYSLEEQLISNQKYLNEPTPHFADEPETPWQWNNWFIAEDVRIMVFRFRCAMDETHRIDFIVLINGNTMIKIGQYPSVADLAFPELKQYDKVATKEDMRELKKAIGLHASGIGIGAFVYLRRIIERIIEKAGREAIEAGIITEQDYKEAPVDKRIKMLRDYLPESLDNSTFYGIVSKGIHELSEEECIVFFPVLQSYIVLILRQWEKMREDEAEKRKISAALNKISSNIK